MAFLRSTLSQLKTFQLSLFICILPIFIVFLVGKNIPYINTSLSFFAQFFLIFAFIPFIFVSKKTKVILVSFLLILTVYLFIKNSTIFFPILFFIILISPQLDFIKSIQKLYSIWEVLYKLGKKHILTSLGILLTVGTFVFFRASFQSYFEGDEWVFFRQFAPLMSSRWWILEGFLKSFRFEEGFTPHITPVADIIYLLEFKFFQLRFSYYLVISLLLHVVTSFVFAKLALNITRSRKATVISTLFFAFNSIHSEGVIWILAAIYTELAVLFGLLSLLFIKKSFDHVVSKRQIVCGYVCLLASLWSKETAVIFPILIAYILFEYRKHTQFKFHRFLLVCVVLIFLFSEVVGHRHQISNFSFQPNSSLSSPWVYSVLNFAELVPNFLFRTLSMFLKMLAQSLVPTRFITALSKAITELQFPYFNQEKIIGGTNYLSFVQSPMPEMISYLFGIIFLFCFYIRKKVLNDKNYRFGLVFWTVGVIPICGILIGFPWLKYDALIGSRHFYHVLPGLGLLVGLEGKNLIEKLQKKMGNNQGLLIGFTAVALFIFFQYYVQQLDTADKQKANNFVARKKIVKAIQGNIIDPPNTLILYSTSNRSYYGFSELMLPFPIPFYQILPILMSKQYNPNGIVYPNSFFKFEYNKGFSKGLVAQGYYEQDAKGLGYYLDKIQLIKGIEKYSFPLEHVVGFYFDGNSNEFVNITEKTRKELEEILESRRVFSSWARFGSLEDRFTFLAPPIFQVTKQDNQYSIVQGTKKILNITIFQPKANEVFSSFVENQINIAQSQKKHYESFIFKMDLDTERVAYYPMGNNRVFYLYAGNNLLFYKVEIFDEDNAKLILRTFEFVDTPDDYLYDL